MYDMYGAVKLFLFFTAQHAASRALDKLLVCDVIAQEINVNQCKLADHRDITAYGTEVQHA